jgi:branched-subunit amino acid aminotransferase/4-amino-4-deoxychorismate lyase
LLGLGLFETLLALDGVPVFADRHLSRLRNSGGKLGWDVDFPGFHEIAVELLARNQLATGRARLRLTVTGGSGLINDLTPGADRLVWLAAFPAAEPPESLAVSLSPWPRNERSPLAGLKTASYAENLVALDYARRLGFEETLFLTTRGQLCEAATANVFLVKNGGLLTPDLASGCLPGIGREVIGELAPAQGIPCEEKPLVLADLEAADEVFLTSATRGPVAVSRFDARSFPPGPITAQLRERWNELITRERSLGGAGGFLPLRE